MHSRGRRKVSRRPCALTPLVYLILYLETTGWSDMRGAHVRNEALGPLMPAAVCSDSSND